MAEVGKKVVLKASSGWLGAKKSSQLALGAIVEAVNSGPRRSIKAATAADAGKGAAPGLANGHGLRSVVLAPANRVGGVQLRPNISRTVVEPLADSGTSGGGSAPSRSPSLSRSPESVASSHSASATGGAANGPRRVSLAPAPRAAVPAMAAAAAAASAASPTSRSFAGVDARQVKLASSTVRRVTLTRNRSTAGTSVGAGAAKAPSGDPDSTTVSNGASGDAVVAGGVSLKKRKTVTATAAKSLPSPTKASASKSHLQLSAIVQKRKPEVERKTRRRHDEKAVLLNGASKEDMAQPLEEAPPCKRSRKRLNGHLVEDGLAAGAPQAVVAGAGELSEDEKEKLRKAVHAHLCQMCDAEDAGVITDFISVMIEDRKSKADMVSEVDELGIFKEGASEFVEWVHKSMSKLVVQREAQAASNLRSHQHPAAGGSSSRTDSRSRLHSGRHRVNSVATVARQVEDSNAIDLTGERPYGLSTVSHARPAVLSRPRSVSIEEGQPATRDSARSDDVVQRKKNLLADYTTRLQQILAKLNGENGKVLSEYERDQLTQLADKIQEAMRSMTLGR